MKHKHILYSIILKMVMNMRVTFNPLKIIHLIETKFVPHVSPWSKETCAESYPILVNKIHNSSHVS